MKLVQHWIYYWEIIRCLDTAPLRPIINLGFSSSAMSCMCTARCDLFIRYLDETSKAARFVSFLCVRLGEEKVSLFLIGREISTFDEEAVFLLCVCT
jgi:hypothetical protein